MFYFAYGSNMDKSRMQERGIVSKSRFPAFFKDYKLKFNKIADLDTSEGKANIVPCEDFYVEGIVYEVVYADMMLLDRFEGYPFHYNRVKLKVESTKTGAIIEAFTYVAQNDMTAAKLKPTKEYLNHLLAGKDFLSQRYYDWLKKHPVL